VRYGWEVDKNEESYQIPQWDQNYAKVDGREKWVVCRYGVGARVGLGVGARVGTEFGARGRAGVGVLVGLGTGVGAAQGLE
jgi:hypothetical protein